MSNDGLPSMTALLGLLAIAGYQNKDKLAEMLGMGGQTAASQAPVSGGGSAAIPGQQGQPGLGGLLGNLAGAGAGGGFLSDGLNQLVNRFTQNGHGQVAQSWVNTAPNQEIAPAQLEQAIGPNVLADLSAKTGLSRDELLARLSKTLPHAVDQYTPEGRLPA